MSEENLDSTGTDSNLDKETTVPLEIGTSVNSNTAAKKILSYPESLLDSEEPGAVAGTRECIRFAIRKRSDLDDIPKAIYLYMPSGFSLADTAVYELDGLRVFGRSSMAAFDAVEEGASGGIKGVGAGVFSGLGGILDELRESTSEGVSLGASMVANKLGDPGKAALIKQGRAINPFQNAVFSGNAMRNFSLNFKLIAESPQDTLMIREIENTFRKFLYPEEAASGFLLKYPPYFQIQFLRTVSKPNDNQDGPKFSTNLEENPNLPFLHLTYLQSMSATYNSGTNVFYEGGAPVELDLALTFQEATNLTRKSLYKDNNTADYTYDRKAITSFENVSEIIDEGSNKAQDAIISKVAGE